jgi:ArsR family transcriptional regulator
VVTMPDRPGNKLRQVERSGHKRAERQLATPALDQVASLCRALGHPLRVRLVTFLTGTPSGGAYVSELASYVKRAQSTVSHHLSVLAQAGIVVSEQRGTWTWYQVVPEKLSDLCEQLSTFVVTALAPAAGGVRARASNHPHQFKERRCHLCTSWGSRYCSVWE